MNYHKLETTMEELLTTLVGFSFHGDMRMRWKMENPDKIRNLVQGSMKELSELYLPLLLEMQETKQTIKFNDDGTITLRHSPAGLQ